MEAGNFNNTFRSGSHIRLRWSDRQVFSAMEQDVELLHQTFEEWVVASPVQISESTQVYLTGNSYMRNGIVQSCSLGPVNFLVTISMLPDLSFRKPRQEYDPGLLEVDSFLTEEEEAKILDSIRGELPYSVMVQREMVGLVVGCLRNSWLYLTHLHRKTMALILTVAYA